MINLWIEIRRRLSRIRHADHYFVSPTVADLDKGAYTKDSPQIRTDKDAEEKAFFRRKSSLTDL